MHPDRFGARMLADNSSRERMIAGFNEMICFYSWCRIYRNVCLDGYYSLHISHEKLVRGKPADPRQEFWLEYHDKPVVFSKEFYKQMLSRYRSHVFCRDVVSQLESACLRKHHRWRYLIVYNKKTRTRDVYMQVYTLTKYPELRIESDLPPDTNFFFALSVEKYMH